LIKYITWGVNLRFVCLEYFVILIQLNLNFKIIGLHYFFSFLNGTVSHDFWVLLFLQIFSKIQNRPWVPRIGPGEAIWWKNQHKKPRDTVPLTAILNKIFHAPYIVVQLLYIWTVFLLNIYPHIKTKRYALKGLSHEN